MEGPGVEDVRVAVALTSPMDDSRMNDMMIATRGRTRGRLRIHQNMVPSKPAAWSTTGMRYRTLESFLNFEGESRPLEPTDPNDYPELNAAGCSFEDWNELWEYPEIDPELCDCNGNSATNSTEDGEDAPGDPEPPSMGMNHEPNLHKRPRHGSEDDVNENPDEPVIKRQRPNKGTSPDALACPFFKNRPTKFQECRCRKLTSISRVIQHISRAHKQPPYCPVCCQTFDSEDARDKHLIERACQVGEHVAPDGVTRSQEDGLRSRSGTRNMSVSDRWFRIWNIIFPGNPKPKSIYLSDWKAEVIEASRRFMNQEGVAIIVGQLGRDDSRWKNDQELKKRLENALSKVSDEWETSQSSARKQKNSGRSWGPEETSQQRAPEEGEVDQGTESESVEGETSSGTRTSTARRSQMRAPQGEQK